MPRYEWDDYPDSYIVTPDQWLAEHLERRDDARQRGREEGFSGGVLDFFCALEVLEDFRLPGFEGPPQNWDIRQTPLEIVGRVNVIVWQSFNACWSVPKNSYAPSQNSQTEAAALAQGGD